jgi:hypothetical protein
MVQQVGTGGASTSQETLMKRKLLSIAAVAGLLIGSTAIVQAQSRGMGGGASSASPGHSMQSPSGSGERSEGGSGASGLSPGHEMREGEGGGGPGASRLAPGHQGTTGAGDRDRDDRMGRGDRDRDDRMGRGDRDRDDGARRGDRDRDDRTTGSGGRDRDDRLRKDRDDRMMDHDRRGVDKD